MGGAEREQPADPRTDEQERERDRRSDESGEDDRSEELDRQLREREEIEGPASPGARVERVLGAR